MVAMSLLASMLVLASGQQAHSRLQTSQGIFDGCSMGRNGLVRKIDQGHKSSYSRGAQGLIERSLFFSDPAETWERRIGKETPQRRNGHVREARDLNGDGYSRRIAQGTGEESCSQPDCDFWVSCGRAVDTNSS